MRTSWIVYIYLDVDSFCIEIYDVTVTYYVITALLSILNAHHIIFFCLHSRYVSTYVNPNYVSTYVNPTVGSLTHWLSE